LSEWESDPAADFASARSFLALTKAPLMLLTRVSSSATLVTAASLEEEDLDEPLEEDLDSALSFSAIFSLFFSR
jgi:hypothetical protein